MSRSTRLVAAALLFVIALVAAESASVLWQQQLQPAWAADVAVRQLHSDDASAAMRSASTVSALPTMVFHALAVCSGACLIVWALRKESEEEQ